jgi:Xaa-Pro dipeptidase
MPMSHRLDKLYAIMEEAQLDAIALVPGSNFRYLTDSSHHLMERPLLLMVPLKGKPVVVIPQLEADLFTSHGFDAKLFPWNDSEGYENAFHKALGELNLAGKKMGVEGLKMRFFEAEILRRIAPQLGIVNADTPLSKLRIHKDADEIAKHRKAIELSEEALRRTLQEVRVGQTEMEIQNRLVAHLNAVGGQSMSFDPIVLAADNSAMPHGHARSDYAIQVGDPLLFDFGTTWEGYLADITRTFFVQQVSDQHRKVYEAVLAANTTGREACKPGAVAAAVDELTRQALVDAGFEHLIAHRTGHGLGMDAHEWPNIAKTDETVLEPGMFFTIEPGLYEAGSIGVRIEDNVVVTENGAESLTTFPRELSLVG